jgi:hypothetical protein
MELNLTSLQWPICEAVLCREYTCCHIRQAGRLPPMVGGGANWDRLGFGGGAWLARLDREAPATLLNMSRRQTGVCRDRIAAMTIGAHEHDPGAFGDLLSCVPAGEQTLEFSARFALEYGVRLPVHQAANESYLHRIRIQLFVTEH